MLDQGLRVAVNSDDPAYFPGYMNENLLALQQAADLTPDEFVHLARNAFTSSWHRDEDRNRYLRTLDIYAAQPVETAKRHARRRDDSASTTQAAANRGEAELGDGSPCGER